MFFESRLLAQFLHRRPNMGDCEESFLFWVCYRCDAAGLGAGYNGDSVWHCVWIRPVREFLGASINLTQQETGTVTTKLTTETGEFQFDFVRPVLTPISIELPASRVSSQWHSTCGRAEHAPDVTRSKSGRPLNRCRGGSGPLVNTVSAEQQQTFTINTVQDLPLARRNFSGIISIGTGVATAAGGSSEGVRMNGVGRSGTGFAVDGTDAQLEIWRAAARRISMAPVMWTREP
jgi:hypothetical protein